MVGRAKRPHTTRMTQLRETASSIFFHCSHEADADNELSLLTSDSHMTVFGIVSTLSATPLLTESLFNSIVDAMALVLGLSQTILLS